MNCHRIQPELVAYHFGVVSDETRSDVEGHLLRCPECLESFLALKREIETAESGPCPSPAARERLRRAVTQELGQPRREWAWWERPLAFGLASAAVVAATFVMRALTSGQGSMPHALAVDPLPTMVAPVPSE